MSSIKDFLPAPKRTYQVHQDPERVSRPARKSTPVANIPEYPHRTKGFIPRTLKDFGDGGAYPEIHVAQYPLNMGRKDKKSSNVLSVAVNKEGNVSYDAIASQGQGKKKVYSSFTDIVEKRISSEELERPSLEEEQETARKTREALETMISGKISSSKPVNIPRQKTAKESSSYFRYTANPNAPGYNPAAKQRVVRMVEAPVDPMQPPKFKHRKAPRGPGSPPVPILHSPPRKITVKDQQSWKIPPCVSNWKNAKGYTIPLDKRLAADGRGLQQATINDKFASLSEALAIAEYKGREELRERSKVRQKISMKEKEEKEAELRDLAAKARMERAGVSQPQDDSGRSDDDDDGLAGRDKIRRERKREREREMRMERLGKKGKFARDEDRDISEKIALGQLQGKGSEQKTGEGLYDSRLFNQSQGMSSGFGQEDEYNVYSKPLRDSGAAGSIYRPKASAGDMYGDADAQVEELRNTNRFRPDKDFQGVDRSSTAKRTGPVQFEKEKMEDPFGLDQFLTDARKGKKAMDGIGKGGTMQASAGISSKEYYEAGSSRQSIRFESSKSKHQ